MKRRNFFTRVLGIGAAAAVLPVAAKAEELIGQVSRKAIELGPVADPADMVYDLRPRDMFSDGSCSAGDCITCCATSTVSAHSFSSWE